MKTDCSLYREQIPQALLGELDPGKLENLDRHLADCAACRLEQELYQATIRELSQTDDVPVPRHFFVYPEDRKVSPWSLFRQLAPAWQGAAAAGILAFGLFAGAALTKVQIRAGEGAVTIGFGSLPARTIAPPPIDTAALEARILKAAEEQNRKETLEWVRTIRAEMDRSRVEMTSQQRTLLEAALTNLEVRLEGRITSSVQIARDDANKSLADLYDVITLERTRDLNTLNARFERLATNGEIRSNQTDAILETLLQVAELRMADNPGDKR